MIQHIYDDGGRRAAGFLGSAGDCVCRAAAIASGRSYREVYDLINDLSTRERTSKRKRGKSSARDGVYKATTRRVMEALGGVWTPTMAIGTGCTTHLSAQELPHGRVVVAVSKHVAAVVYGVLYDTHDCSRGGSRCVYGYWTF